MSIDELRLVAASTPWFSRLGQREPWEEDVVALPNLEDWGRYTGLLRDEPFPVLSRQGMAWLPTTRDMDDPINGRALEKEAEARGRRAEVSREVLAVCEVAMDSLRSFEGHPLLKAGSNDFTEAARGAALFAFRTAAYESLLDQPGFWCRAASIYRAGHWPMGLMPDRRLVVL